MLNGEIEGTLSAAAERLWALFVPAIIDSSALIILNRFEGAWQSNLAALSFFQTLLDVDHDAVGLILDDAIPCFHVLLKYEDVVDAFNICRSVGWPFDLILDYIRALLRYLSPSLSPPLSPHLQIPFLFSRRVWYCTRLWHEILSCSVKFI